MNYSLKNACTYHFWSLPLNTIHYHWKPKGTANVCSCRYNHCTGTHYRSLPPNAVLYRWKLKDPTDVHLMPFFTAKSQRTPPMSNHCSSCRSMPFFTAENQRIPPLPTNCRTAHGLPLVSTQKWPFWATIFQNSRFFVHKTTMTTISPLCMHAG